MIHGRDLVVRDTGNDVGFIRQVRGDVIELEPNQYNVLLSQIDTGTVGVTVQSAFDYESVTVIPRYALL